MKEQLVKDLWIHLGGLLALAFGALDLWHFHQLSHDGDLLFAVGGLAALGVKLTNGIAASR